MSESPYIPFYTSDFLGGTSGMTAATKGVYITLLSLMYEAEGPLTQAWDTLARRSGCTLPAFKKAIETLVDDGKVEVSDAGIWSEKCDKHIAQRRERSDSAKAAAGKRWEKIKEKQRKTDANAMRTQCQPEPEPEIEKEEPNGSSKKSGSGSSKGKGTRLPYNWHLPMAWGEWAVAEGMDEFSVRREGDRFADYWHGLSGARGVKRDWQATWRNWIRKALDDRRPKSKAGKPQEGEVREIGGVRKIYQPALGGWVREYA